MLKLFNQTTFIKKVLYQENDTQVKSFNVFLLDKIHFFLLNFRLPTLLLSTKIVLQRKLGLTTICSYLHT